MQLTLNLFMLLSLDNKVYPYDLIWEDDQLLAGKV